MGQGEKQWPKLREELGHGQRQQQATSMASKQMPDLREEVGHGEQRHTIGAQGGGGPW